MRVSEIFEAIDLTTSPEKLFQELFIIKKALPEMLKEQETSIQAHLLIKMAMNKTAMQEVGEFIRGRAEADIIRLAELLSGDKNNAVFLEAKIYHGISLKQKDIQEIVSLSLKKPVHHCRLTIILVLIKLCGLSDENTKRLSLAMAYSGEVFDYRSRSELDYRKLLRRYPTGAVSEKIALVMPALLRCFTRILPISSPFLVARSLSFTGGTWDKLSTIDGFTFPAAGDESFRLLKESGVCMSVTLDSFNPSDRLMYKLRSLTNTVISMPLIISSIASKQIASPVDYLLLDVRFGKNAFLDSHQRAMDFYEKTKAILSAEKINTQACFTDTELITGSTIGNLLEVLECVAMMKQKTCFGELIFSKPQINSQLDLIFKLTGELIFSMGTSDPRTIYNQCEEFLATGELYISFKALLEDHRVGKPTLESLDLEDYFTQKRLISTDVFAAESGVITSFNQREMGNFVNFELNRQNVHFEGQKNGGILLLKHEGDYVDKGDLIARIFSDSDFTMNDYLFNLFIVWQEN